MATEQELQSLLLRLSILLATSLSTLSESLAPTIISDPSSSSSSSSSALSTQILGDLKALLTSLQKACTNLTLALRPEAKGTQTVEEGESASPTSGLASTSLDAAKAQLVEMTNEVIPKLTWLCRKASSEATVYRYVAKTSEDLEREREEREFVRSRGGHVVQHPHSREGEKLEKVVGRGLGVAWSKRVVSVVVEVHEALGDLSEAYMSERTLSVLKRASKARTGGQGEVDTAPVQAKQTVATARQAALQATAVVWEVCDEAIKGKLPEHNRAAVTQSWKARTEVLKDAMRELKEALQEQQHHDQLDDPDDPLAGLQDMALTDEDKGRVVKYEPLIRAGCQLHAKAGELCLSGDSAKVDYDELDEAGVDLSSSVDDLVSSLLYPGNDSDGSDDSEDSDDDVQDAIDAFTQATARLTRAASPADAGLALAPLQSQFDSLLSTL